MEDLDIQLPAREASPGRGRRRRRMPRTTDDAEKKIVARGVERGARVVGQDGERLTTADPVEQQTIRDGEKVPGL